MILGGGNIFSFVIVLFEIVFGYSVFYGDLNFNGDLFLFYKGF